MLLTSNLIFFSFNSFSDSFQSDSVNLISDSIKCHAYKRSKKAYATTLNTSSKETAAVYLPTAGLFHLLLVLLSHLMTPPKAPQWIENGNGHIGNLDQSKKSASLVIVSQ